MWLQGRGRFFRAAQALPKKSGQAFSTFSNPDPRLDGQVLNTRFLRFKRPPMPRKPGQVAVSGLGSLADGRLYSFGVHVLMSL